MMTDTEEKPRPLRHYICRCCGIDLSPGAERTLGVCTSCIQSKEQEKVRIPGVSYDRHDHS